MPKKQLLGKCFQVYPATFLFKVRLEGNFWRKTSTSSTRHRGTRKKYIGTAENTVNWTRVFQIVEYWCKNPINHYNFKNQAQIIRLFSDYFKWLNKKPMCWLCIAPKKNRQIHVLAKRTKNFTDFSKIHDKQAFARRNKIPPTFLFWIICWNSANVFLFPFFEEKKLLKLQLLENKKKI